MFNRISDEGGEGNIQLISEFASSLYYYLTTQLETNSPLEQSNMQ